MTPYCVKILGRNEIFPVFYLTDYNSIDEMVKTSIKYLMHRKYSGYRVYLHNFARFDSMFLIDTLSKLSPKLKTNLKDGFPIELKYYYGPKNKDYLSEIHIYYCQPL